MPRPADVIALPDEQQTGGQEVDNVPDERGTDEEGPDDYTRDSKMFPNSIKITGIKHICDNLVGAVLRSMPRTLACIWIWVGDSDPCEFPGHASCCLTTLFVS